MTQTKIKLLHTADLHLDSPLKSLALKHEGLRDTVATASRTALTRIVDHAMDESVAAVLIAGDLFDGAQRSARTGAFLVSAFDRLQAAGIRVFAIYGNHDAENSVSRAFDYPANVHVFDGRGGSAELTGSGIWIHGVSFRDRHAPESLLPKFPAPVQGAVNIGLLHTSLTGAEGHDRYAPCSVADLVGHGYDYWALGHVHKRQVHAEDPFVVMPGMPQGRDVGEAGPKSATLIEVSDGRLSIAALRTSAVEFQLSDVDVTGAEDSEALRHRLRTHLQRQAEAVESDSAILRLRLTGAAPQAWQIRRDADLWAEMAADLAEETGRIWIERLEVDVSLPAAQTDSGAVAELAALMDEIRGTDAFRAEAQEALAQALAALPAHLRDQMAASEDAKTALAESLAERGASAMVARLRGTWA